MPMIIENKTDQIYSDVATGRPERNGKQIKYIYYSDLATWSPEWKQRRRYSPFYIFDSATNIYTYKGGPLLILEMIMLQ